MDSYHEVVKGFLRQRVTVSIDRPLGSRHPKYKDLIYLLNYGEVRDLVAPDGDYQDAYVLGVNQPLEAFTGVVIAIIHRLDDNEDKLVVAPDGVTYSDEEIEAAVAFQERWFKHTLVRQGRTNI